jgi:hypothetical protein
MDHPNARADWQQFARPEFRLRFQYPAVTPQGRAVERSEDHRDDAVRVHLTTRNKEELYFEVSRFPDLAPPDEYVEHSAYLEQRFGAGPTSPLTETSIGWPAWAYAFQWDQGERSVLLLQVARDTYPHPLRPALATEPASRRHPHDRGLTMREHFL